jgi:hypothetical protein
LDVAGELRFYELSALRKTKTKLVINEKAKRIENLLSLVVP